MAIPFQVGECTAHWNSASFQVFWTTKLGKSVTLRPLLSCWWASQSLPQLTLQPVSDSSSGDAPHRCILPSSVSLFLYLVVCAHVFPYDLTPNMICPQPSFSMKEAFALSSVRLDFPAVLSQSGAECAVWGAGMHKLLLCLQMEKKNRSILELIKR